MTTTRSTRNVPSYISLFSGAGGLDIGLEMAGWKTAYASDNDQFAVDTLKANVGHRLRRGLKAFDGTFIENADITTVDPQSILQKSGLAKGDVQLIAGGPPCQSWSSAGHQLGFNWALPIRAVVCSMILFASRTRWMRAGFYWRMSEGC